MTKEAIKEIIASHCIPIHDDVVDYDFDWIADDLIKLFEREKKECVKHFAFLQIDRIERSIILSDDKQVNSVLKATAKGIARSYKDYTGDGNEIE